MKIQDQEEFLRGGIELEAEILRSSQVVRDKSKQHYDQGMMDARLILSSIFWKLLKAKENTPGVTTPSISERITLIMTYIQGIPACETMISEGQYIKAAAALKQDYEIMTRIREVKTAVARPGGTPNVRHAPAGTQRFYGELNDVAHPSSIAHLQSLLYEVHEGDIHGVSCMPTLVSHTAKSFYTLHIWLMLELAREYILLMLEMYPSDSNMKDILTPFAIAVDLLEKAGFIISE